MRDCFLADPAPNKLNLAVGVYRTAHGKPLVLDCVQDAEINLLADQKVGRRYKEYLPPEGMRDFCELSLKLLLGDAIAPALSEGRVALAQSLSGTGGLHLAARLVKQLMPSVTVYLPTPTWPIHPDVFAEVGLNIAYYPYYDPATRGFDAHAALAALHALPIGSVVLLHACAHNPTGVDPTPAQWRAIAAAVEARRLIPLVDAAYLGLASGDIDVDSYGARTLAAVPGVEMITVQSYAKTMGLYAERAGVVAFVCNDADVADRVRQQLVRTIRLTHSSPPMHGAAIAQMILADAALNAAWRSELRAMAQRLLEMRAALSAALAKVECPPPPDASRGEPPAARAAQGTEADASAAAGADAPAPAGATGWQHVLEQRGMFTYTGLSPAHVQTLREKHHVYMPADGRICMAALTSASCDTFAAAVKDVLVAEKEAGGVPEGDSPARKRPRGLRGLACLS